jgi:hypothetical protein
MLILRIGWPDAQFWTESSGFWGSKNYIGLMRESCAGCIKLPKYRRFRLIKSVHQCKTAFLIVCLQSEILVSIVS